MIKKFILMILVSSIFVSCNVSDTELKVYSSNRIETAFFEDFFDFEIVVRGRNDNGNLKIIMDKNTEVLYIMSHHYGISPIYDSDGSILTKEKWLAKHVKKD